VKGRNGSDDGVGGEAWYETLVRARNLVRDMRNWICSSLSLVPTLLACTCSWLI
jgi:hypothetical protein